MSRNSHPHTQATCPVPRALRKALAPVDAMVSVEPPTAIVGVHLAAVGADAKKVLCRVGCGTIWYVWPSAVGIETLKARKNKRPALTVVPDAFPDEWDPAP